MAKITNQSGLVLGTNLFLHVKDAQLTNVIINSGSRTITRAAGSWLAATDVGGLIGAAFAINEKITVDSILNKFSADIESVTALVITWKAAGVIGTPVAETPAGATINIQRSKKFIEYRAAGALSLTDGVIATALSSKMQTLWKDNDLDKFDPISSSIEPRGKAMYFLNDWDFFNLATQRAHRGGAVQVQDSKASAVKKIYGHLTAPSTVSTSDQWRFWPRSDAAILAPTAAITTGFMDELVLILDVANSIDNRGVWFVRCAEPGKSIAMQERTLNFAETIGVTVTNAIDPKLGTAAGPTVLDATILAGGIYANIDLAKTKIVALSNTLVGTAGNVAISRVGANIVVVGMIGGAAAVKAKGSITLTALPADGNTVVINDGTNPALTFTFRTAPTLARDVKIEATDHATLTNLFNAINDVGSTLNIIANQGLVSQAVEGTNYDFAYNVEYDNKDYVTVHTKINWLLRQTTNVNQTGTGPVLRGDKQFPISVFVGNTQTIDGFPLNFLANNQNDMRMLDQGNTERKFNTVASFTIVVPQAFINPATKPQITVYVGDTHGGSNAIPITNSAAVQQKDITLTAAETSISFAYSTFNLGGHAPNTDLPIAIAFNQPSVAEAEVFFGNVIQANTSQRFQLAPSVDPSYVA